MHSCYGMENLILRGVYDSKSGPKLMLDVMYDTVACMLPLACEIHVLVAFMVHEKVKI